MAYALPEQLDLIDWDAPILLRVDGEPVLRDEFIRYAAFDEGQVLVRFIVGMITPGDKTAGAARF